MYNDGGTRCVHNAWYNIHRVRRPWCNPRVVCAALRNIIRYIVVHLIIYHTHMCAAITYDVLCARPMGGAGRSGIRRAPIRGRHNNDDASTIVFGHYCRGDYPEIRDDLREPLTDVTILCRRTHTTKRRPFSGNTHTRAVGRRFVPPSASDFAFNSKCVCLYTLYDI
jgi:hypothetical protein